MTNWLSDSKALRSVRRFVAVLATAALLVPLAAPVTASADQGVGRVETGVHLDRPLDGVGDSPLVP